MTSSTKSEVRNVSPRQQGKTERRPQLACTENLIKLGRVVFEICERTDRKTNKQTDILITTLRIHLEERLITIFPTAGSDKRKHQHFQQGRPITVGRKMVGKGRT